MSKLFPFEQLETPRHHSFNISRGYVLKCIYDEQRHVRNVQKEVSNK